MPKNKYRVTPLRISQNPAFSEASKEELRTLLALIETDGVVQSDETIAAMAGVSLARCRSAIAFWEECGIISPDDNTPRITLEFEERLVRGEIDEVPAQDVAESIREENLSSMIDECAMMLGQSCLSHSDVKLLTALRKILIKRCIFAVICRVVFGVIISVAAQPRHMLIYVGMTARHNARCRLRNKPESVRDNAFFLLALEIFLYRAGTGIMPLAGVTA